MENVNNLIDEIKSKVKKFNYYTDPHINNIVDNVNRGLTVDIG